VLPAPRIQELPRAAAWLAVALALLCAAPALALDVALDRPRAENGYVWVDARLSDLFAPRIEQSLTRGMPATLELHVELWRHRGGWFDRMLSSFDAPIRLHYEVGNESFWLERPGTPALPVPTLDSVRAVLSRPIALPAGKLPALQPGGRYYIAVTATLKPLTVEDVEEVEGWLSGEVDKRRSRFGFITALPRALFDAVRNVGGFGDQKARALSGEFDLDALQAGR
jgi:hypothetical protein